MDDSQGKSECQGQMENRLKKCWVFCKILLLHQCTFCYLLLFYNGSESWQYPPKDIQYMAGRTISSGPPFNLRCRKELRW